MAFAFNKLNNSLKSSNEYQNNGLSRTSDPSSYPTRSQTRRMAEEDETRFEQLEMSHQETREQISEMMEMIRALVREKGQTTAPNPQNGITQSK